MANKTPTVALAVLLIAVIFILIIAFAAFVNPTYISTEIRALETQNAALVASATAETEQAQTLSNAEIRSLQTQNAALFQAATAEAKGGQALETEIERISQAATSASMTVTPQAQRIDTLAASGTALAERQATQAAMTTVLAARATTAQTDYDRLAATAAAVAATATARAPISVTLGEGESVALFGGELSLFLDGYSGFFSDEITFTVRGAESARQTFEGVELGQTVFYQGKHQLTIFVRDILEGEDQLAVQFLITGN